MKNTHTPPVLVWLREDLRVDDNRALNAAVAAADARGSAVHAIWCVVPQQWDAHGMGDNRRWFLLESARELLHTLADAGIALTVIDAGDFAGSTVAVARQLAALRTPALFFNDEYPLNEMRRDALVADGCTQAGVELHRFHDSVLVPPAALLTRTGTPYSVFTPWRQAWYRHLADDTRLAPRAFRAPAQRVDSALLQRETLASLHAIDEQVRALAVPDSVRAAWQPGEREARRRLKAFAADALAGYREQRDLPAVAGTSTLSPYLAAGCLSPRRALAFARDANRGDFAEGNAGAVTWISELGWRDFYKQVMYHHPHVSKGFAFRRDTDRIAWRRDERDFAAWCTGETGVPLVDAAMRQLVSTGWMHNRLRMVTAMYLSKDLLIDWRLGEAFFAKHLVDWDFAANNGGWQWSASTGTDAAPYFRLFNPVRQGERFDPAGDFVRQWLPALRNVPDKYVHAPWLLAENARTVSGSMFTEQPLDRFAPPRIDHERAKARVMAAFRAIGDEKIDRIA
jgi:deoxyribodipyrimidine photo-lyase